MEGGSKRGLGTDHVISVPMKGLKKLHQMARTDRQLDGQCNFMTESTQCGQFSEKSINFKYCRGNFNSGPQLGRGESF